ncbi:MAG: hypothetical protein K8I30_24035 [Anaerolineae bacterium]|nr:hypothetical protein [Anaerolineae bacterium]
MSVRRKLPLVYRWIERMLHLPRFVRVVLCAVLALAVTLALSPLIDEIYLRFFFSSQTVIVPALISAAFGLLMYMLGWWLVIGTVGEMPPIRMGVLWYIVVGLLAVSVVVILVFRGVTLLNLP